MNRDSTLQRTNRNSSVTLFFSLLLWTMTFQQSSVLAAPQKTPPKANKASTIDVEVLVPSIIRVGEGFPVLYRTRLLAPITLSLRVQDVRDDGTREEFMLQGQERASTEDTRQGTLTSAGIHHLEFTFVGKNGQVGKRVAAIKVLSLSGGKDTQTTQSWDLPNNTIYLTKNPTVTWNQIPGDKREKIEVTHPTFIPLKSQSDLEDEWCRLQAWNDLVAYLQPQWLPERDQIQTFINIARPSKDKVAYTTFTCKDTNFVYMAEIGKQSWLYIEEPTAQLEDNKINYKDFILDSVTDQEKTNSVQSNSLPYMMRYFDRYRSLLPEGSWEHVNILLVHTSHAEQVNLVNPKY